MRLFLLSSVALFTLGCAVNDGTGPRATPDLARDITELGALGNKGDVLLRSGGGPAKVYCQGTSCYAVAYEFVDHKSSAIGPYTVFTAYLQNLQGTYPSGSSTPVELNRLSLHFPDDDGIEGNFVDAFNGPLAISKIGPVNTGIANLWQHDGPANPGEGGLNYDSWIASVESQVIGCDVWPANPPGWFSFQTCPILGIDGWVKVEFVIRRFKDFLVSRPPVRLHEFVFFFGTLDTFCSIGGKQPDTCTEVPYRRAVRK